MNSIYDGMKCPFCHARFFEDEDIVYCPVCGAPHHRECWNQIGHCMYEADHGTERQWKMPADSGPQFEEDPSAKRNGPQSGDRVGKQCPKCGRLATSDTLFCPYCGYSFEGQNPPDDAPFNPFGFSSARPYTADPLGGVPPTATIDGEPVMDVASFVALNTPRYIPKFKSFEANQKGKKKKVSWNWCAFLFPSYWLMFRKCYGAGVAAILISIASQLLTLPLLQNYMSLSTNRSILQLLLYQPDAVSTTSIVLFVCSSVLMLLSNLFFALFGDYIYKSHCMNKIKVLRQSDAVEDIHLELVRRGGVNIFSPLIVMMLVQFLYPLLVSFI